MKKTKTLFGVMIIFIVFLIFFVSAFYVNILAFQKSVLKNTGITGYSILGADYVSNIEELVYIPSNASCKISEPSEKTVILRLDDVGAWHYFDTVVDMTDKIVDRNMSVSLGVIPHELEKDRPFLDWIVSIRENSKIEIAQHGYIHDDNEFLSLNSIKAYKSIQSGKEEIRSSIGIVPVTFIPPSNAYTDDTLLALEESEFRIISARDSEFSIDNGVWKIGSDTNTFDYFNKRFIPVEEVVSDCESVFLEKNLCVITIHPQDYLSGENYTEVDDVRYNEFVRLLDEINALGFKSKTFKDLIECS